MLGVLALVLRGAEVLVACSGPLGPWDQATPPGQTDNAELDARVLSILRDPSGNRWRDFRATINDLVESEWDAWPVRGPRTLLWVCRFIAAHCFNPMGRHTQWLQLTGLKQDDPAASDHEQGLRMIELAACYDQSQAAELAAMEVAARRVQLAELKHRDKLAGALSTGNSVDEDSFLYMGTGRTRGLIMVCPALEEFVAQELAKEAATAKERRKLREERAAAKGSPNKK